MIDSIKYEINAFTLKLDNIGKYLEEELDKIRKRKAKDKKLEAEVNKIVNFNKHFYKEIAYINSLLREIEFAYINS